MKNNTEIVSDMNEKHGLVTQVSFKCPVLPGWRTAILYNPYRIGSDLLASAKAAVETPEFTAPRHRRGASAPGRPLPPSPAEAADAPAP